MACRRYRNRRIGEFLKELGLTEGRNTGIHKILKSLRENGSPEPLFETDDDRLYFMVTLYARTSSNSGAKNEGRYSENRITRQRRVLGYLAENPRTSISDAVTALNISRATLNRDIATLKEKGHLSTDSSPGNWHLQKSQ